MYAPKICTLNRHDEAFSKHEVLLNESLFHSWKLSQGTLLRLSASSTQSRRSSTFSLNGRVHHKNNAKSNDITLVFRYQELPSELLSKYPNLQVSVSDNIASSLNLPNRSLVTVSQIEEESARVSHVEIAFRDAYLTRADMWRMVCSELAGKPIYKGQKINFLGSIKACVKSIYRQGTKLTAGVFGPSTKPIFRSESARYVIYLQISKEMWDFEPEGSGEIMFSKVIDGFLPELFKRWSTTARHLISIVLFTRMEYSTQGSSGDDNFIEGSSANRPYRDFYRVLTSNMESGHHKAVLLQLKIDFKTFLRDISIRPGTNSDAFSLFRDGYFTHGDVPVDVIQGHPAPASRGNILEAINTASSQFSEDHIDRDLLRTGLSIVIVTPGTGVFEVDAGLLNLTTDILVENGVGIDLVCLARMPLHSVPLFKYRKDNSRPRSSQAQEDGITKRNISMISDRGTMRNNPVFVLQNDLGAEVGVVLDGPTDIWNYAIPHWLDISFWTGRSVSSLQKSAGIRCFTPSNTKSFLTRVKMYEIQMMGIMGNETNGVSIPYLETYQESSTKDLKIELNALRSQVSSASLRSQSQRLDTYGGRLRDSISNSLSPRSPGHIDGAKALSSLVLWMENHDQRIFKVPKTTSFIIEEKRPSHTRSHTVDTGVLSTPDRSGNYHKNIRTGVSIPKRAQLLDANPNKSPTVSIDRKVSNASSLRPSPNLLGSIKGGRSFSFGFKGFGSHTTKAAASVELSSETAHRESLLTHVPHSLIRSVSTIHGGMAASEDHEVPWTPSDERRSLSRPTSPPSKPILIKQVGKNKQSSLEQTGSIKSTAGTLASRHGARLSDEDDVGLTKSLYVKPIIMRALAPWFTVLNPSNPDLVEVDPSSRLGRWHHVFPRPLHASTMKWKSLCAPASIPLTSEAFPTAEQLASEYESSVWSVSAAELTSNSEDQDDLNPSALFREMICARFSRGYQIIIGEHIAKVLGDTRLQELDIFNDEHISERGSPLYMSRGIQIHRLTLREDSSVEVKQLTRIKGPGIADELETRRHLVYAPYVKTSIGSGYEHRSITFSVSREVYNWKRYDNFVAGREQEQDHDLPEELRYWRARYVLIPMPPLATDKKASLASFEDNDEEIRLEGIYKLTQLWQKNRFMPVKESHQRIVTRTSVDTNPLDIIFRTKSPSAVVASELHDLMLEKGSGLTRPRNLLPESELLTRSAIDLKTLAQLLQSKRGVEVRNRPWHVRLHSYTFDAIEFVTWLVDNFKDIDDRETAIEFGEQLRVEGLFSHVDKRHNFRDGNFFYIINTEYRLPRIDKNASWFSKLASVPSTPVVETRNSPKVQPQGSTEDEPSESGLKTPTDNSHLTGVTLSKKLIYDVDRRKKSYRREIINLHYDRVSSADDCYHIRINWLNVTPKLVEDAVSNWASAIERYRLRLVEIPISEASRVNEMHTFRSPYIIKLAKQPPSGSTISLSDPSVPIPDILSGRFPYHKALLKKFDYVLDLEAADDFPSTVNVCYSWGKPDYQYPQFISRDGLLLAQITHDGNFLLLANRLSNNRRGMQGMTTGKPYSSEFLNSAMYRFPVPTTATKTPPLRVPTPRQSPFTSPMFTATPEVALGLDQRSDLITPLAAKDPLETFCQNAKELEKFYEEVRSNRGISTGSNTPEMAAILEGRIQLPPVPPLRDIGLGAGKR
ncbi:MAG: hypothetical protein GOMPHAMPRED_004610 [Gomphillus americanus]|uniref:Vacuolar membrane-associated protein IML1 n=1 Tax=Gomphillus americanus TaxID=1940652 RepID=A0A8H3IVB3_9LECA|nr:MAG: hypothetical protein GOMPHAMPRED_004610 [Gomphillus americanus]